MTPGRPAESGWPAGARYIVLCLMFAGAVYQWPLFSENQNLYFLPGLAHAGFGALSADLRAQQFDITPVFSALVTLVHLYGWPWMYYAGQALLVAMYACALWRVVRHLFPEMRHYSTQLVLFGLLVALHSAWMLNLIKDGSTVLAPVIATVQDFATATVTGVAGQDIPGAVLQPSSFGVLLLTSLALFMNRRVYAATLCAVAAATVHTSLIVQAGFLVGAYTVVLWREGQRGAAYRVAALGLISVLPISAYVWYWMVFVDPPAERAVAQFINVFVRQPLHTQPSVWFSYWTLVQLAILGAALWVARGNTRLCLVLGISTGLAGGLTLWQVATSNQALAVLFPWRASVWLIPMATMITLGRVVTMLPRRAMPTLAMGAGAIMTIACGAGVWKTVTAAQLRAARDRGTMIEYVQQRVTRDQTYLVPTDYAHFRLSTGAPIFVDWKSSPNRGVELVDWDKRVRLVKAFYSAPTPEAALDAFHAITAHAPITHVVIERAHDPLRGLPIGRPVYEDHEYVVYDVQR